MLTKRNKLKKNNKTFRKNNKVKKYNKTFRKKSKKLKINYKNKTKKKYLSRYNIRGGNPTYNTIFDAYRPFPCYKESLRCLCRQLNFHNLSEEGPYKKLRYYLKHNSNEKYIKLRTEMASGKNPLIVLNDKQNDFVLNLDRRCLPSNLFILIAKDLERQTSMKLANDLLNDNAKQQFKVCRNMGHRDQYANDDEKAKDMGASMSQYHVFFTTKNQEWSYFNCLTFGIEDHKLEPAIKHLEDMLTAAKDWVNKCRANYEKYNKINKEQIENLLKMYDIFRMTTKNPKDPSIANTPDKDIIKFVNKKDNKDIKHYTTKGVILDYSYAGIKQYANKKLITGVENMNNDPVKLDMDKIYKDGILFFENPLFVEREINNIYKWSNNVGYFFHMFPHNSVESLHLHIVDIDKKGLMYDSYEKNNIPADTVFNVLQNELDQIQSNPERQNLMDQFYKSSWSQAPPQPIAAQPPPPPMPKPKLPPPATRLPPPATPLPPASRPP